MQINKKLTLIVLIILLPLVFVGSKWIQDYYNCEGAGFKRFKIVDARDEGIFEERFILNEKNKANHGSISQSVLDLVRGRYLYFEVLSHPYSSPISGVEPIYKKFYLKNRGDIDCIQGNGDPIVKAWQPDKCLALSKSKFRSSRYRISAKGYHYTDQSARTIIYDDKKNDIVSKSSSYILFTIQGLLTGHLGSCGSITAHEKLVSLTFLDSKQEVYTQDKLNNEFREDSNRRSGKVDLSKLDYYKVIDIEGLVF